MVKDKGTESYIRSFTSGSKDINEAVSLLVATLEATTDGILVVDLSGIIVLYNKRFTEMWSIPKSILATLDDNEAIKYVLSQLKDPDRFIDKIKHLYANPTEVSYDVLEFKDGRIFERYSFPVNVNNAVIGRVWRFRDVTDHMKNEEKLKAYLDGLAKMTMSLVDRRDVDVNIVRQQIDDLRKIITQI